MLAIFLAPVYILANVFTAYWLLRWMKEVHPLFRHPAVLGVILVLYAFFALSLLTSFLIKRDPVHRILKVISNCWLGMYLYFLGFTAILVLLRFIFAHTALMKTWLYSPMGLKAVGLGAILFVTGMCIYGMVHAVHIYTTRYEVPSKKDAHLKIALVADLHLGYSIGSHQMEEMVEKINAEEPDVVVIAGDIFDNEYDAIYEPDRVADLLAGLKSRYGTYACYGNHDIEEPILAGFTFRSDGKKQSSPEMDSFLASANIRLLRDEAVLLGGEVYLYGRPDAQRPGRGIEVRNIPVGVFYPEKAERVSHFRPGKDFTRISILNTLLVLGALLFYYPWRFLRSLTRERVRRFIADNITRSKDSNPRLAASIGLGVFFGIAPLWGYQMIAAAVTAHFTRLNKAVAVISSNISIPPMIPFILYGSYWTGAQVLQRDMPLSLSDITLERVAADLVQYIAGSFTMAAVCGAAATAVGYALLVLCKRTPGHE